MLHVTCEVFMVSWESSWTYLNLVILSFSAHIINQGSAGHALGTLRCTKGPYNIPLIVVHPVTCPQTFDNFWRRSDALSWSGLECGAGVWEGAISPHGVKGETDEAVKSEGKGCKYLYDGIGKYTCMCFIWVLLGAGLKFSPQSAHLTAAPCG